MAQAPISARAIPLAEKGASFEHAAHSAIDLAGDVKTEFVKSEPSVVFSKWSGESVLGLHYPQLKADAAKSPDERLQWRGASQELHAYALEQNQSFEDGGIEIEILLLAKPATHIFEFSLSGHEDLLFFYQPPLTQMEIDLGAERPEHVVGSYAIYHATKRHAAAGKRNYATGKFGHIYRPKAVDAAGTAQWCDLTYKNGVLAVMVPQTFLDAAVYPVTVDPTFGYTSVGASNTTLEGSELASWSQAPDNGNITDLQINHFPTNSTRATRGAIWAYTSDTDAGNLLATSAEVVGVTGQAWRTYTISLAITAGAKYFLGAGGNSGSGSNLIFYDSATSRSVLGNAVFTYPSFNSPFVELSSSIVQDRIFSIYANYTLAGGSAPFLRRPTRFWRKAA